MNRLSLNLKHQNIKKIEKKGIKNKFKNFVDYLNKNNSINNKKNYNILLYFK